MERNKELLMKHIIEDMSDGVIAIGFDSRILVHNRAAAKILGMDNAQLSGKSIAWIMEQTEKNDELFELITDSVHTRSKVERTTIIDIYDALTADDRPYKPPMALEKAFSIL